MQAELVRAIACSREFRDACLDCLMDCQTTDERAAGTSLERNGRGFNKRHAAMMKGRAGLTDAELEDICVTYTSQLEAMIEEGVLRLPDALEKDASEPAGSEGGESEDEELSEPEVHVNSLGAWCRGRLACPSHAFRARLLDLAHDVSQAGSGRPYWDTEEVHARLRVEIGWQGCVPSLGDVDAALFGALPPVVVDTCLEGAYVRLLWGDGRWLPCLVRRVYAPECGVPSVKVEFIEEEDAEERSGLVTGCDTAMMYRICKGSVDRSAGHAPRKRRALRVEDDDL